jgi:ATP-dependent DNA helicase RecG
MKTSKEARKETENSKKTSKKVEHQLVDLIRKNSQISVKDLSKLVELSIGGVRYHLEDLKKKGILKRIGPDRGGHWEILNHLE